MADKVDPRTGELLTANYGWTKPTVGASVDAWGGYINSDLDGIDSVVHGIQTSIPAASTTTPAMAGTAAVGTGTTWARADHIHPTDARIIGESRIINGDMLRDQRNNGASGTAHGYTVDRWTFGASLVTKGTWQQAPRQGVSGRYLDSPYSPLSLYIKLGLYSYWLAIIFILISRLKLTRSAIFGGEQQAHSRLPCRFGLFPL